jgi:hypothetical protein
VGNPPEADEPACGGMPGPAGSGHERARRASMVSAIASAKQPVLTRSARAVQDAAPEA